MSKSIKDYKEAMDSVKISESFYKRTENLLAELPETETEKPRPVLISGKRISAVIMSAAACVICVLGIRLAAGNRTETITQNADESGGAETSVCETNRDADELIDKFDEYDDGGIVAEEIEEVVPDEPDLDGGEPAGDAPIAVNPCSDDPQTAASAQTTTAVQEPIETTHSTANQTTVTTKSQTRETTPNPGAGGDEEEIADDEPYKPIENPATGKDPNSHAEPSDFDVDVVEDDEEIGSDGLGTDTGAAEKSAFFGGLDLGGAEVEITPYFDMDGIKAGETVVRKSGEEFKPTLDLISGGMEEYAVKIGNSSFTSVFSVRIYSGDTDLYSIYLTNYQSIVITRHNPDGSQLRETYALRLEYYQDVRHWLFLNFGSEEDYELFLNLIGGK
ncbi:MAG: hypothetical protein NC253_04885 [Ruminococcus sp.]|nr:hypothetical protein [Ruminococcus sp.]